MDHREAANAGQRFRQLPQPPTAAWSRTAPHRTCPPGLTWSYCRSTVAPARTHVVPARHVVCACQAHTVSLDSAPSCVVPRASRPSQSLAVPRRTRQMSFAAFIEPRPLEGSTAIKATRPALLLACSRPLPPVPQVPPVLYRPPPRMRAAPEQACLCRDGSRARWE
ncbi:hypothetical protein EJ04DRAFT_367298 [Polyplosphaeria fusca]|uniref:Uncharacterized protein n=1 Tax=Polyplosphaeria fusca TaxID=682080 RepID=A0A9P4QPW8_9PLEO|nr:hypothetical protein EJ04DRAFT_367298 [Polyplosphaeria fusca]